MTGLQRVLSPSKKLIHVKFSQKPFKALTKEGQEVLTGNNIQTSILSCGFFFQFFYVCACAFKCRHKYLWLRQFWQNIILAQKPLTPVHLTQSVSLPKRYIPVASLEPSYTSSSPEWLKLLTSHRQCYHSRGPCSQQTHLLPSVLKENQQKKFSSATDKRQNKSRPVTNYLQQHIHGANVNTLNAY